MAAFTPITGGIDTGRMGGRPRIGSKAFHRQRATRNARAEFAEIFRHFNEIVRNLQGITPSALREALEPAYDKSQVYVPRDRGFLANSGRLEVEWAGKNRCRAQITYGNPTVWYAAIVHERLDLNHDAPTSAKFLSRAMEEHMEDFRTIVAKRWAEQIR
jgi:hypothetical protein